MKYLCLLYHDESATETLPETAIKGAMAEMNAFAAEARRTGHYVAAERLRPARSAKTIRKRDGNVAMTDGPFAETKEQLGGFYLLEAKDLDEALRLAATIPAARWGSVEVRPVWERDEL